MIVNVQLNHLQIKAILADAAGVSPDDIMLGAATDVHDTTGPSMVTATVEADAKGFKRLERLLSKWGAK